MTKTKLDMIVEKSNAIAPFKVSNAARKNTEVSRMDREARQADVSGRPYRVRLELTNKCNVNCVFCYRTHFRTDDQSVMTPEDIDRLEPMLRTAEHISLSQKAESLMSPYIVPILDKMAAYDAIFYMSSNGQLLNDEISNALIRNKITFLTISANAFNEEYEDIYVGGKIDQLEKNLTRLNHLKMEAGSVYPRLRLSFVLRKDTLRHLDDALDFVQRHRFSEGIQVLSFFSYTEEDRHLEPVRDWGLYEAEMTRIRERAKRENVPFDFSLDVDEGMRAASCTEYAKTCYEPWESFNVMPGGNVLACTSGREILGNIRDVQPLEIWRGDTYQTFRKGMNGSPYNLDCKECWHCRYVSAEVTGKKVSKMDRIFDTFYRRAKPIAPKAKKSVRTAPAT